MSEEGGIEKRRHKRGGAKFFLEYKVCSPFEVVTMVGGDNNTSVMTDLSESGAAFLTEYNLPVGTVLEIKFTVITRDYTGGSKHQKIIIRSEVKNSTPMGKDGYRVGIEFINVDAEKKNILDSFVKNKD